LLEREAAGKAGDTHKVYLISDLHIGNVACHKRAISRLVRQIASEDNSRVCILGDTLDAVAVTDKRYQESALDPDINRAQRDDILNCQLEMATEMLAPLAGKIDIMLIGNHEEHITRSASVDLIRILAKSLDAPYRAAYTAYLRYIWRQPCGKPGWTADYHLHHGAGGGKLSGAKVNAVERRAGWVITADVVASGHNHKRSYTQTSHLSVSAFGPFEVKEKIQHCFNTGSFLRGWHTGVEGSLYTERCDYPPSDIGCTWVQMTLTHGLRQRGTHNTFREILYQGGMS
jgi:hypothetical protein